MCFSRVSFGRQVGLFFHYLNMKIIGDPPVPFICFPLSVFHSFNDVEQHNNSDVNSEINSSSHLSSLASNSSSFMSTSESSYSSDQGSGSEDSSFMYEESSDEVDQGSI